MTNSTTGSGTQARIVAKLDRLLTPVATFALASVLVLVGVIAVLSDNFRLGFVTMLVLQGGIVVLLVNQRLATSRLEETLAQRIDQASARQLADLARTRHALLSAVGKPEQPR
ncbi:MAG: hypothetical protein ABIN55_10875 [Aeromicrobium sp.]